MRQDIHQPWDHVESDGVGDEDGRDEGGAVRHIGQHEPELLQVHQLQKGDNAAEVQISHFSVMKFCEDSSNVFRLLQRGNFESRDTRVEHHNE